MSKGKRQRIKHSKSLHFQFISVGLLLRIVRTVDIILSLSHRKYFHTFIMLIQNWICNTQFATMRCKLRQFNLVGFILNTHVIRNWCREWNYWGEGSSLTVDFQGPLFMFQKLDIYNIQISIKVFQKNLFCRR